MRNDLREALEQCKEALDSVWAAIGDALCSGNGIEKAYANGVANEARQASDAARAALAANPPATSGKPTAVGKPEQAPFWLVENVSDGKFEGWFTAPPMSESGWLTTNWQEAKRYSKQEAEVVADALNYFKAPFRWSRWKATEHLIMDAAQPAKEQAGEAETDAQAYAAYCNHQAIQKKVPLTWHSWKREQQMRPVP